MQKLSLASLLFWLAVALPGPLLAQYVYTTNNGAITITQYTGPGGEVSLPSSIDNLPVMSIGDFAFYSQSNVTAVTVPDGVTDIGFEAFFACGHLSGVTLSKTVARIGDWAFQNCTNLVAISVDSSNPLYRSVDGVLFDKDQSTLLAYPGGKGGSFVIPANTVNIGVGAFGGAFGLTSVWISEGVTNVSDSAFYSCSRLTSVTISNGVRNIGSSAFYACRSLTNAELGGNVIQIGDYAFASCAALSRASLGAAIGTIGYGAFSGSGISSLVIPDNVKNMGDAAFEYCSNLASVVIGKSLTGIPNFAFDACDHLTSITLGNSVASIGVNAFGRCTHLSSLTIPGTVTNIGDSAFLNCTSLRTVYFLGNAPVISGDSFSGDNETTIFYLPLANGWSGVFGGLPTAPMNLQAAEDSAFGITNGRFGFNVIGPTNLVIVVEASEDLAGSTWTPVLTNALTFGLADFADAGWTNHAHRFYRIRPQ